MNSPLVRLSFGFVQRKRWTCWKKIWVVRSTWTIICEATGSLNSAGVCKIWQRIHLRDRLASDDLVSEWCICGESNKNGRARMRWIDGSLRNMSKYRCAVGDIVQKISQLESITKFCPFDWEREISFSDRFVRLRKRVETVHRQNSENSTNQLH